ncbi:MAG: PH domain-containing protein [Burkholderiaceae bacterium]
MHPASPCVHRSRVDAWLLATLLASVAASLWAGLAVPGNGGRAPWWASALIVAVGAGLPLWLLLDTRYVLADGCLSIRCGPFRWRIALDEIRAIAPSRSPVSSPALSLDRLKIDFGRGRTVLVSPRDPARFVADVEAMRAASGSSSPR